MPASPLLINNPPISPVIICTGFHRSATSLPAQLLHSGGLDMGRRLVANHISNPDGHFDDVEMVALNDALLHKEGTDWRFHDEVHLPLDGNVSSALQRYLECRDATHVATGCGLKDPAISL